MGLDTTYDAWNGPYGAFSRWRKSVAVAAGIIGKDDDLYGLNSPIDWLSIDAMTDYYGKWSKEPSDPIWTLLAHSDCDGEIKKRHLIPLADRLEGLLDKLEGNRFTRDNYNYRFSDRGRAETFIEGLRRAAAENKKVKFF